MLDTEPTNAALEEAARIYYETHMAGELPLTEEIIEEALMDLGFTSLVTHLLYRNLCGQEPSDSWKARKLEELIEYLEDAGKRVASGLIE